MCTKSVPQMPLIVNSELGRNGRFGNQLFQYMFLATHAARHGIGFANGTWIGDEMFNIQAGVDVLPEQNRRLVENAERADQCPIRNAEGALAGCDVSGYFQFPTGWYADQKTLVRKQFTFRGEYAAYARTLEAWMKALPGTVVGIHIRRGDYGTGVFFRAPSAWYRDWLARLQDRIGQVTVYLASDEADAVLSEFKDFNIVSAADAPSPQPEPGYFTDFAALTLAPHVAISNSSFSFAATMLNANGGEFMRPSLSERRLIAFDPWDAPVLLTEITAEQAGETYMSAHAKRRSKYRIRKFLGWYR